MKKVSLYKISLLLLFPFYLNAQIKEAKSNLEVDHVFFLTNETQTVIKQLQDAGLTLASKWQTKHDGQGTTGNFFFFLNTYIEILAITDVTEAKKNEKEFGHNYTIRTNNGLSKTGIGLRQIPLNTEIFPFKTKVYKQNWMGKNELYMALSNNQTKAPLFFIEPPTFANMVVDKLSDLNQYASQTPELKTYRQHKLGLEKLTSIEIITTETNTKWGEALAYFKTFQGVTITEGKSNKTILVFDYAKKQKQIDLSKELGLIIKY